ncbi:MAG: DUF1178 family protein [Aquabacterium sp.]
MKVFNLRCPADHRFEGWFGSEDDFVNQGQRGLLECPLCGAGDITRMPSAPRLNMGAQPPAAAPAAAQPVMAHAGGDLQAAWMQMVRHVLAHTDDVGTRFPEEARRMHYGEIEARGIRGHATPAERQALSEEGIEVTPLPIPKGLDGPGH